MNIEIDPTATQMVAEVLATGGTLGELRDWTDDEEEALYIVASNLYDQGKYSDALKSFGMLLLHHHTSKRYHFGFGACLQMLKNPEKAVTYYGVAAALDLMEPEPPYRAAECLIQLGRVEDARDLLKYSIATAKGNDQHAALQSRAAALLEALEARLAKSSAATTSPKAENLAHLEEDSPCQP